MTKLLKNTITVIIALLVVGCQNDLTTDNIIGGGISSLTISVPETRTHLGTKENDTYPLYWSEGDKIIVNGNLSNEATINPANPSSANFEFDAIVNYPLSIIYSATTFEGNTLPTGCVYFPQEQHYEPNTIKSECAPMYGFAAQISSRTTLNHLAGILRFSLKAAKEGVSISKILVESNANEPLSGIYTIDCTNGAFAPTSDVNNDIAYICNTSLSTTEDTIFHIVVPCGTYEDSCTISFVDSNGTQMTSTWTPKSIKAGVIREFKSITYKAGTSCTLEPFGSEDDYFFNVGTIVGFVKDTNGKPLGGVVISDGVNCVATNSDGYYSFDNDIKDATFIWASIPSGYKALNNDSGIPQFYHKLTEQDKSGEFTCKIDFVFEPITTNPNRYSLIIGADPQPRAKSKGDDRIAFHSLDICEDLYRDMRETRATITDREVYGMMLGDIVHENMSLYANYVAGLSTLNFQMFNIIGNHDHDLSATTDVEGARCFEDNFGPSYYSFNIGKQHYVVLDNVVMTVIDGKLKKNEYTYGLTDKQWQWLQNDLSFVNKSTTLMVASHIPMFKKDSAKAEYQDQSAHGADYANLLKQYNKVHVWAGHTHRSFNYNYPSSNTLKNIEVHTLARSTGELWTNDYNAYGTPRGYTVVDIDGDNISWKFKPTAYQTAEFIGNNYSTVGAPEYAYRDWNYDSGVAVMKSSGKKLDDTYQMKVWKDGSYIYAHIFMWDDKWATPKLNGSNMTHLDRQGGYTGLFDKYDAPRDYAYQEIFDFYSVNSILSGYDYSYAPVYHNSIFRGNASGSSATITVTDRFGNDFSSTISW
ncbi:MAG: calcineurin-like phosphoesterase C-terminal domain-containing protein [Alistipes sp.]|nr:calcineurin-like phosphoesterase C-terminal domain-containing protein [Alistipes sp.]